MKKSEVSSLHDYELDMLCFCSLSLSRFPSMKIGFANIMNKKTDNTDHGMRNLSC